MKKDELKFNEGGTPGSQSVLQQTADRFRQTFAEALAANRTHISCRDTAGEDVCLS